MKVGGLHFHWSLLRWKWNRLCLISVKLHRELVKQNRAGLFQWCRTDLKSLNTCLLSWKRFVDLFLCCLSSLTPLYTSVLVHCWEASRLTTISFEVESFVDGTPLKVGTSGQKTYFSCLKPTHVICHETKFLAPPCDKFLTP